jgi:hypothetical protein
MKLLERFHMDTDCLFQELGADGTYSGDCTVGLDGPVGHVTGPATIRTDQNSKSEAQVSIEEFEAPPEYGDNLFAFLNASPPKKHATGSVVSISATADDRRITSLKMDTDNGSFTASSGLVMTPWLPAANATLSLTLNDLAFTPHTNQTPKYWFVALQGPFSEHRGGRPTPTHPMALDGGSVITFAANGRGCGLQIFDPEKKPSHPMATYDAIAFGEISGLPGTLRETWDTLPRALVEALSFCLGVDVAAPWIELRSNDGSLARRFYFHIGHRSSPEGFPAFTNINESRPGSGIGAFLAAFFSLPEGKRDALIAPLNLMRSGAPGASNIEDSITDLVKALDNLCQARGLTTQDLLGRLEPDNRQKLTTLLTGTRDNLGRVVAENKAAARQEQVDVLNIIVSRVANVTSKSRDFGIAVKDLLKELNLHDAEVLDRHYASLNPPGSWAGILSAVRGEVIHNGVLRIKDVQSLRSWFEFSRHLHDLCKRIIFREVNYGGTYQSSTNPWKGHYAVDRVTPTMTVKDLGFSQVPTHI